VSGEDGGASSPVNLTEEAYARAPDYAGPEHTDVHRIGSLSDVLRKWEEHLAALEESKRRRVVVDEIGLLRVILDSRIVVRKYERNRREG
jgi:hypothetical protein